MSMISTERFGRIPEHLVGDLPVFGVAAIEMDSREGAEPETSVQRQEQQQIAAMLSGELVLRVSLD
jgi:hypothetical protein